MLLLAGGDAWWLWTLRERVQGNCRGVYGGGGDGGGILATRAALAGGGLGGSASRHGGWRGVSGKGDVQYDGECSCKSTARRTCGQKSGVVEGILSLS